MGDLDHVECGRQSREGHLHVSNAAQQSIVQGSGGADMPETVHQPTNQSLTSDARQKQTKTRVVLRKWVFSINGIPRDLVALLSCEGTLQLRAKKYVKIEEVVRSVPLPDSIQGLGAWRWLNDVIAAFVKEAVFTIVRKGGTVPLETENIGSFLK